jgi:hypothetical protein
MAFEDVNANSSLLSGYYLQFLPNHNACDLLPAIQSSLELYDNYPVVGMIGGGTCAKKNMF